MKKEIKFPFESGNLVWCNISSATTTRGNSYIVRNVFAYWNRNYKYYDFFITIKNDFGWTVKVNAIGFRKRMPNIPTIELLELRIKNIENKLKNL
jgi:hypothetical protein